VEQLQTLHTVYAYNYETVLYQTLIIKCEYFCDVVLRTESYSNLLLIKF